MKHSLIVLSGLTALTFTSNIALNITSSNTNFINKFNNSNNFTNPQTTKALFNNIFGYLSQDSWITNQSTADHKYYSYDTSHAVGTLSNGTPTKNAFIVDNTGSLIIDTTLNLSDNDKNTLNNIKAEMINHKKVIAIKNDYNLYSKSIFNSNNYFTDNSWQYLQMGQLEKHIDISKEQSANKVEHSDDLSETWGLYYISKAERNPSGIDSKVANNLGQYFISQSSLKNKVNAKQIANIINTIVTNNNVYNLFYYGPSYLSKNVSSNYIFDSNNNIIEVSYNQWDNSDFTQNLNIKTYETYSGNNDYGVWRYSGTPIICNFTKNGTINSWNDFINLYPTLTFDDNSFFSVYCQYDKSQYKGSQLKIDAAKIDASYNFNNNFWSVSVYHDGGFFGAEVDLKADAQLWHDDHNIYIAYRWFVFSKFATQGCFFSTTLNQTSFINVMK